MAKRKRKTRSKKKQYADGIPFDSKYEKEHYLLFKEMGIPITGMQVTFELKPKIKYKGFDYRGKIVPRTFRGMVYTPDFIIDMGLDKPVVVEVKGHARKDYMMRKKLFIDKYKDDYYFIELKKVRDSEKKLRQIIKQNKEA